MDVNQLLNLQGKHEAKGKYVSFLGDDESTHRNVPQWQRRFFYCPTEDEIYLAVECLQGGMLAALAEGIPLLQSGRHFYASLSWIVRTLKGFQALDIEGFRQRTRQTYEEDKARKENSGPCRGTGWDGTF